MPTEQIMNSLVINKVDKTETLNAMKKMEDFDASQVYVVEDPLGRIPVTTEEVEDYDTWIEPGTGASVLKYRDPSSGEIKKVGGGSTVHISDEPPASPEESNVWIDTSEEGGEDSYYTKEQTEELVNNRIDAKFEELDPADIGAPTIEEMNAAIAAIPAPDYTGLATEDFATNAAAQVKDDLLNGAGSAYDTLKELGELIDDNVDAIEALETVAASKANSSDLTAHTGNKSNPHDVTAAQVGARPDTWMPTAADVGAFAKNDGIGMNNGDPIVFPTSASGATRLRLYSGRDAAYDGGAGLILTNKNASADKGNFTLTAHDGTNSAALVGKPDGTMTWKGNSIYHTGNKPTAADVGAHSLTERGTLIPNGSDLNTYTTPGDYYVASATNAATLTNTPTTSSGFRLIVERGYPGSNYINQIAVCSTGPTIWIRATNGTNTLSEWRQLLDSKTNVTIERAGAVTFKGINTNTNRDVYMEATSDKFLTLANRVKGDTNNRTAIWLNNEGGSLANLLQLNVTKSGTSNTYKVYHTGNKPTAADVGAATTTTYNATVTTSWTASGSYYYQNITVSGITANDNPIVDVKTGTDNAANKLYSESIGKVIRIVTAANKITVYATEKISTAFPIQLKVVR